ncbi:phosphoribosyltransferase [Candidatus Microgenomates bacterium]|nr:phosphoribosyltransferase [Candidatus Microgenomates bacterium]
MFQNRYQAGQLLGEELKKRGYGKNCIILAIPRGGVVTGKAVADILGAKLDVVVVRKLGAPPQPELAVGAVGPGGIRVINQNLINSFGLDSQDLENMVSILEEEIKEREEKFRSGKRHLILKNKIVILVDDGIATGATIEAALEYIKSKKPLQVVLAAPVASADTLMHLEMLVDSLVVLEKPVEFGSMGQFYGEFPQVTDEEVVQLLL